MHKESQNVDKRCTLSSLVSSDIHLYAMNDKSKATLVCGTDSCIKSHCLWGYISHSSCALMWYGAPETNSIWHKELFHTLMWFSLYRVLLYPGMLCWTTFRQPYCTQHRHHFTLTTVTTIIFILISVNVLKCLYNMHLYHNLWITNVLCQHRHHFT